jgi:hypothetical protein
MTFVKALNKAVVYGMALFGAYVLSLVAIDKMEPAAHIYTAGDCSLIVVPSK